MTGLIDTHCHLNFEVFQQDLAEVIHRANESGITKMINPAVDLETSQEILSIAEKFTQVYAAVGIHPNSAKSWHEDTIEHLTKFGHHPQVVAIGEIGLDFYRDEAPPDLQLQIFVKQLELAENLQLPVIIHNRSATQEVLAVLSDYVQQLKSSKSSMADRPGVLHSFSADVEAASQALDMNFLIGITGPVTFKNAAMVQQVVREVPLDSLLIETDSPFLPPHPYRGKRNEPAYVRYVAEKIAELKDRSVDEVGMITSQNAERLFGWSVLA